MLEAKFSSAVLLKKVLEAIKDLVSETNFDCSSEGISLQAMDPSHVALVSLYLKADGFESYRCDRNMSLGINMASLAKILKCANNDDAVSMTADEGDTLTFEFVSTAGNRTSKFVLKLLELNQDQMGIPDQEYTAKATLPAGEFQRISRDLAVLGETVAVSVKKDELQFSISGDIGSGTISVHPHGKADAGDRTTVETAEPVAATFSLRYFNHFTKATPLSTEVNLQISGELPLVVQYQIPNAGHVRFYLAPKMEGDGADGLPAPTQDKSADD